MSDTQQHVLKTDTPATEDLNATLEALKAQGAFPGEEPEEGSTETTETTSERPEWLPEKFKSAEDLAKAYAELEKKLSGGKKEEEATEEAAEATTTEDAQEAVEKAGLNFEQLEAEYAENGKLSDKAYKALEKAGIPRSMVDAYIEGQQAQVSVYESQVKALVGGDDEYTELVDWAGQNLSDDEIEAFDEAVNSFDMKKAKFAVEALKARREAAYGTAPKRQVDGRTQTTDAGYESVAQMEADMRNPLYHTDEAFRQKVMRKIAASKAI